MPKLVRILFALLPLLPAARAADAAELLTPQPPLLLAGTKGKFDFIHIDLKRRRLLAAHTGNGTLDLVDLDKGKLTKSVPTGAAQDCAIDQDGDRYLVSVSKPPQLAIVDANTLEVAGVIPLSGPADLLDFDPASGHALVGHDDSKELWVIDPVKRQVLSSLPLPGEGPEGVAVDHAHHRLIQAVKLADSISVFDLATSRSLANWPTAPARAPHGIALTGEGRFIAIAGGNGKLVLMDASDGKVVATGDMPEKVDEVAYDAERARLYCASALGKLAIFKVGPGTLEKLGELTTSPGAKSVAVDVKTHTVWLAYMKDEASYVQAFRAAE